MRHVFTTREKVLLVILAVLVIAVGYWKLILTPINDSIADLNAQTASEQDAILTNSARLSRMRQMQQELETLLADPDAKPLPDYDNLISDVTLDLDAEHGTRVNLTITYFELQSTGSAS